MTRTNLDKAIARLAGNDPAAAIEKRMYMALAIVGQFVAEGVLKGGTALKLRFGAAPTRYTMDLDAARRGDLDAFLRSLRDSLAAGWEGFTGEIGLLRPASPQGVPWEYVMQPCEVKLRYNGRSWCTVRLEIGHNEIGDADIPEFVPMPDDMASDFKSLCFPIPLCAPLMPLEYQVAQKLHGLTASGGKRVRDLVDLQIIATRGQLDLRKLKEICQRLFAYRKCQTWPPFVEKGEEWQAIYQEQSKRLPVLQDIDAAIAWANSFIVQIDQN